MERKEVERKRERAREKKERAYLGICFKSKYWDIICRLAAASLPVARVCARV